MIKRLFLVYLLVELAVLVGLVYAIGFGWTLLAVLATFLFGLALAGRQLTRHLGRLQSAMNSRSASTEVATDSALVALGAVLVFIPGVASTVLGALLLMPPTRRVARPVAVALIGKGLANATPLVMTYPTGAGGFYGASEATGRDNQRPSQTDYVDGEVIDVVDIGASEATGERFGASEATVRNQVEPTSVEPRGTTPD